MVLQGEVSSGKQVPSPCIAGDRRVKLNTDKHLGNIWNLPEALSGKAVAGLEIFLLLC